MPRLTREDWLAERLHVLAEGGITALTIDSLTRALHVTKGSFYHHFGDFAAYKTALLDFFEQVSTRDIMAMLGQEITPLEKLQRLFETAALAPPALERTVRAWAFQDAEVRDVQARIDQQRIAYVQALCEAVTVDRRRARRMGQLAYVILVGAQQVQPPLPAESILALFAEFRRFYELA